VPQKYFYTPDAIPDTQQQQQSIEDRTGEIKM